MKPWLFALALVSLVSLVSGVGCHEEPPIVIRFEPNDLSQTQKAAPASSDAGATPKAAVAVADAGAPPKLLPPTATTPPSKGAECKLASECVIEPVDCCDCANGGKQHAIAKKAVAASKAARQKRCKNVACTMMLSTDPTCGQRADCVAGHCEMVDQKK